MLHCEVCDSTIRKRLEVFAEKHGISGCDFLYPHFRSEIDRVLPGLFELVETPQKWIGNLNAPWFPVSPELVANENLHVELVTAPLPFVAAVVRVACPHCARSHRIVHIGANFYILASHLGAFFAGTGLPARQLIQFALELQSGQPNWSAYPAAHAVPRDMLAYGMAWVMCHEIGHFASPNVTRIPGLDVPAYAAARLIDEANADRMSFAIMLHRAVAMPQHRSERISAALAGVFLILNTWNLLIPKAWGRQSDITAYGFRVGAATPSPTLRWNSVRDAFDTLATFGVANADDYTRLKDASFPDLERKMFELQEMLDEFSTST